MCMWDVIHGRRRYSKVTAATLTAGQTVSVTPNARRVAIWINGGTVTGLLTVSAGNPTTSTNVIAALQQYSNPLEFRIETHGDLVVGGFVATASIANVSAAIIEIITNETPEEWEREDDERVYRQSLQRSERGSKPDRPRQDIIRPSGTSWPTR